MEFQKQTNNSYIFKILSSAILILSFSVAVLSQTKDFDKTSGTIVTDDVMQQVVRNILTQYFKPRNQTKEVYLFRYFKTGDLSLVSASKQRLQKSWLPKITGSNFQLLSTQKSENKNHYVFTNPEELSSGLYKIGFAYGCYPSCGYMGETWNFRISKKRVIIWKKNNEGFGSSGEDHGSTDDESPPIMKKND